MQVVGRLAEFDNPGITKAKVGDTDIVIVRDGTVISAFAANCPHAGAPLAEGALCYDRLVCPWHKATFRISDGSVLEPPALDALTRHAVRIDGDSVLVSPEPIASLPEQPRLDGRTVLILGSGAGGTAAAVFLREAGFSGCITVIGQEALEPYDRTVLSKFVLADMKPSDVPALRRDAYWTGQRIDRKDATIARVDAAAHQVHLADATVLDYDAAVLATGATANVPTLPGAKLSGVHTLRNRQDAASIVAVAARGSRAVIVGSSFIGLEAASALHERGVHVTVVSPENVPFVRQFGPEIGTMFRRLHEANGTVFRSEVEVESFGGTDRVSSVVLKGGDRLPADFVILGVGVSPATGFVDGVQKADDGGIVVDATLRAADGLYVIGDAASFPFDADHLRIEHWRVAQQHGRVAALNIAGVATHYDSVPFFWTYHFGKRFEYLGHGERWDRMHIDGQLDDQRFVALQIRGEDVVGVVACQRERATARLIERMRQPLSVAEATDLLRTEPAP
jgi:NADPH-dependent 2,4-dienoyl-CoA reductase/sulfur reductase-like enzyme/nitrite reductase/ring-hydroxylating ferredoxin subunit